MLFESQVLTIALNCTLGVQGRRVYGDTIPMNAGSMRALVQPALLSALNETRAAHASSLEVVVAYAIERGSYGSRVLARDVYSV